MRTTDSPKGSAAISIEKDLPDLPNRLPPAGLRQRIRQICIHLWIWELLSLLLCVSCVGTIIILLLRYDGKPLPAWDYGLTINGVISVLAGIAKASMILPVAECISQLKWHWFWNGASRPLVDFQVFDAASRGPWGCFMLLCRPRQWSVTSFGAIITIAALLMEPSLQFIPSYPSRMIANGNASLSRSLRFKDVAISTAVNQYQRNETYETYNVGPMSKHAFYSTLFGTRNDSAVAVTPQCSTGNCTWPTYPSLGVCNACADVTSMVYRNNNPVVMGWWLPNNVALEDGDYYSLKFAYDPLVYNRTSNQSLLTVDYMFRDVPANASILKPQAFECRLYFCVKTYSSVMRSGVFTQNVTTTWPDANELVPNSENFVGYLWDEALTSWPVNVTDMVLEPSAQGETYSVDPFTLYMLRKWLFEMVHDQIGGASGFETPELSTMDLARAVLDLQRQYKEAEGGPVRAIMDQFAESYTTAIHQKAVANRVVEGRALSVETIVEARWGWAILPVALVSLTCLFMTATLVLTVKHKVPVWKSSALATLAHGLDESSGDHVTADRLDTIERKAENCRMAMDGNKRPWQLRTESISCCE